MFIKIKALEQRREGVGFEKMFEEVLLNTDSVEFVKYMPNKKAYVLVTSNSFYSVLEKDVKILFDAIGVSLK